MSFPFDSKQGLIVVFAHLWGPTGDTVVRLALDTGATATVVNAAVLRSIGYDPALSEDRVRMTTGSGIEFVPRLPIETIESLGQRRNSFIVVCHSLPPTTSIDGLLGLDFMREQQLMVDFRTGVIEFE